MQQLMKIFFDKNNPPTIEDKKRRCDRRSKLSPFSRFVGNHSAVKKLEVAAFTAFGKFNHQMTEMSFAFLGPASAGKTSLARLYAETVELPFIEISPKSLNKLDDLVKLVSSVLEQHHIPLIESSPKVATFPPCVIFIDEVHALKAGIIDGLLKATEYSDQTLVTESGRKISTEFVTWMIATTDEGKLPAPFRTRFTDVVLECLNKSDLAKVVQLNNPDFSEETCKLVAHYNARVPRQALQFARMMKMVRAMEPDQSWDTIAKGVAEQDKIDEFGMREVHLQLLKALGNGPIAKNRIHLVVNTQQEECEGFILPQLLVTTSDQPALVRVSAKGYTITMAGLTELDKRNLPHNGSKALGD